MEKVDKGQQISFLDIFPLDSEENIVGNNIIEDKDEILIILSKESFPANKLPDEVKNQIINLKDITDELWQNNPRIRWMWCRKCHMFYQSSDKNEVGCRGVCHCCS